jgi:NitT/TauT family transport system permease protein
MSDELLVAEIHAASVRREQRSMLARTARKTTLPVIAAAIVVVAWEIAVDASGIKPAVLPAPSGVLSATFANRDILIANALPTTLETIAGFILSLSLGGLLGVLLTYFALVRDALYPNVILFQLIPKVAVAPLFMLWLGIGWESRVAMALFIAFFPIVISTVSGLQAADPAILRLCDSLDASRWQVFFKVRLPYSLPFLFNGMKISMTLAIIGVIVGEFITSQQGLGYIILFAGSRLETATVMAALLVLCTVGLALYGLVGLVERIVMTKFGS